MPAKPDTTITPATKSDSLTRNPEKPVQGYATLKLFTTPWANIYIDGEFRGKTPFVGEIIVPLGVHRIKLVNPYCQELVDTVKMDQDTVFIKKYSLKPKK